MAILFIYLITRVNPISDNIEASDEYYSDR